MGGAAAIMKPPNIPGDRVILLIRHKNNKCLRTRDALPRHATARRQDNECQQKWSPVANVTRGIGSNDVVKNERWKRVGNRSRFGRRVTPARVVPQLNSVDPPLNPGECRPKTAGRVIAARNSAKLQERELYEGRGGGAVWQASLAPPLLRAYCPALYVLKSALHPGVMHQTNAVNRVRGCALPPCAFTPRPNRRSGT